MESTAALSALSALAQPLRMEAFRLLVRAGPAGLPAGEVARRLGAPANTVSAALALLRGAGLARSARQGRVIRYSADMAGMRDLIAHLMEDCCGGDPDACRPALDAMLGAAACEGCA